MHTEYLVKMTNDIAHFFEGELEGEAVAEAIATHLTRFWAPPMRKQIIAYIENGQGQLVPSAYAAVKKLAAQ